MPKADDIFRPTAVPDPPPDMRVVEDDEPAEVGKPQKAHSGRVKHDEKMTVYISSDELLDLEAARLVLRRTLGSAVDRGKLVRAAVALALEDLEANGDESAIATRLKQA